MAVLDWKHHALIQALLTRGPMTEKEFHSVFSGITGLNPDDHPELFKEYLLMINKELSFIQFDLRACRDQYNGQVYYGVANDVLDEQSKLGTKYSAPQIAFFKGIVEAIAEDLTGEGCISNIDALIVQVENQVLNGAGSQSQDASSQVPAAFRNFTLSQKEKTLHELVQDKWLCHTEDGKIGVGVRSILDLRSWFRNADVPSCEVCNETCLKAKLCPSDSCTVRIHLYCLMAKFSRRGEVECPSCGTKWPYQVAKREAMEQEHETVASCQSQPSQGSKKKKQRSSQNDSADTVGYGSQASIAESSTRRITRSSTRLR
ncbi:hypothetical protein SLE2022_284950 [Rubroshorea leprosula]